VLDRLPAPSLHSAGARALTTVPWADAAKLVAAHAAGKLQFFGKHAHLTNARAFAAFLGPLRRKKWFVYTKEPFAGPKAVLAYISRYTHRVAISNRRLIAADKTGVTFKYKDYRIKGAGRFKTMTLATHEFIRRFLMHVLPTGFHRVRHYGLFANSSRANTIAHARALLASSAAASDGTPCNAEPDKCPCCGGGMRIIEIFERGSQPHYRASAPAGTIRIDTS
jgi:hypothetical protein